jgi:HK97 gp10 family phage protein
VINIDIEVGKDVNLEYLHSIIGEFPAYLEKYLWKRMLLVAQSIVEEAKSNAPVSTEKTKPHSGHGMLRASIVAVVEMDGIAIRCEVPYAKFQEFGTKYILPKMFMSSAMQNHYEEIRQTVVDVIREYFEKVQT